MSRKINKKALSDVIAIFLFLIITLLIFSIVFFYINKVSTQLSPVIDCSGLIPEEFIEIEKTCIKDGELIIDIKRDIKSQDKISSIEFIVSSETDSLKFRCGPSCGGACNLPSIGVTETYYIDIKNFEKPTTLILSVNECSPFTTKEITQC